MLFVIFEVVTKAAKMLGIKKKYTKTIKKTKKPTQRALYTIDGCIKLL